MPSVTLHKKHPYSLVKSKLQKKIQILILKKRNVKQVKVR